LWYTKREAIMAEHTPGRIRASDTEREQVVSVLREAMSEGRLTLDEGEERIAAAYAATYRDELPAFTADLPPAEPAAAAGRSRRARMPAGRPRPSRPPAGLVALLAVAAGIWALAGGPLWPAIVLGVLTIMVAKSGACHGYDRRRRWQAQPEPADRG
jgi:hypothetical protein